MLLVQRDIAPSGHGRHQNTCSFMACSRCRKKKMTMAEFEAHQKICMPLIRCKQCDETNPSSMKDHPETCNYRRCTLCGKWKISLEQLYSHQLACIKLRRCKGCQQSVKVADYFTHVDSCEPYYCKQCGKQHSVLVDNLRPEGPQTRRCTQCKTYFSEEESHCCNRHRCGKCKFFFPKDYLNEHLNNCKSNQCPTCKTTMEAADLSNHQATCTFPWWSDNVTVTPLNGPLIK